MQPAIWGFAITVWVLAGGTCRGTSSLCILYPLCLSSLPLSHGVHLLRNSSPEVSRPVPTVSCCHLATTDHLEIYPTIKSFSRNPALQTWNARQSLSGWATQSQSWTVYRLPSQRHLSSFWLRWWVKLKTTKLAKSAATTTAVWEYRISPILPFNGARLIFWYHWVAVVDLSVSSAPPVSHALT